MQQYQFDKIYSELSKKYGKIRRGEESSYEVQLMPMEMNALRVYRKNPSANGRRMKEAITLVLWKIKGYIDQTNYDVAKFRDDNNAQLEHALLMAFDPQTNEEIGNSLEKDFTYDLKNVKDAEDIYTVPIRCLIRISESVDMFTKDGGADAYFMFLQQMFGNEIDSDDMKYALLGRDERRR